MIRFTASLLPARKPRPALRRCVLAAGLLLLPASAPAQTVPAAKSQIQAQYRRLAAALARNDTNAYRRLHTPDCLFLAPDGKPHSLDALTDALANADREGTHIEKAAATIRRIGSHPAGYVVQIREQITLTKTDDKGEFGTKGQNHTVVLTTSGRDLWQKTNGVWLRRKAHMTAILSLSIDGKRTPKPAPGSAHFPPR